MFKNSELYRPLAHYKLSNGVPFVIIHWDEKWH